MESLSKFGWWQMFLAHPRPEALFNICGIRGKYTAAIRYALKKKNDIIWEFFPNVGECQRLISDTALEFCDP